MADRWIRWPDRPRTGRIGYGGDYNPEQWDRATWDDDVALMRRAGVNLVTVGVFSWARIQPTPEVWDFAWLDEVLDLLHEHGIAVDLATATASPPPWMTARHPDVAPVDAHGTVLTHGSRQTWSPSSPTYRRLSVDLVRRMAERYGEHPALAMWHVSNELGCHNSRCYSEVSAAAFRDWLRERHGSLEGLNTAWATTFWSQLYGSWDDVLPPRASTSFVNPTQQLDFARFSSDQLRAQLRAERAVLAEVTPDVPVTTNFMVMGHTKDMDYASWTGDVDLVSNDHYVRGDDPRPHVELAFSASLTRGLADGGPWMLMEHSRSAVNWQPVNLARDEATGRRHTLTHLAHGADALCYFQWRQSVAGAEKWHAAMLPHAGADTEAFAATCRLGADLDRLGEIAGSRVVADVALVFDYEAWWAAEQDSHPSSGVDYHGEALGWFAALQDAGHTVDVVPPSTDLSGYRLVVLPTAYLVTDDLVARIGDAARGGAHVVVTWLSGLVDANDHVRPGRYPGGFAELVGAGSEELRPVADGVRVGVVADGDDPWPGAARSWTEPLVTTDADVVARYADGPSAGHPAVTTVARGGGRAWYVGTALDDDGRRHLARRVGREAGARSEGGAGLEVVRRRAADGTEWAVALNHGGAPVGLAVAGTDLLTGSEVDEHVLAPSAVAVVRVRE